MVAYKNVLVLYVGGTIGMQRNADGVYAPVRDALFDKIKNSGMHDTELAKQLGLSPDDTQLVLPDIRPIPVVYRIKECWPLLDSSNMSLDTWSKIAKDLEKYYDNYDGFVVLHGTDTMAYGASALSFMLENLQKPVVLTGAQVPIFETRSDGKDNFLTALLFAGLHNIPEVCACFNSRLLRGNRTVKISSNRMDAFHSPNYHPLAELGADAKIFHSQILKNTTNGKFAVRAIMNPNVVVIRFFPTITEAQIEGLLQPPIEGAVLQTYGAGNIPSNRREIIDVLRRAIGRGVLIVNVTQCHNGPVSAAYETGKILEKIGVIAGHDMTAEAALMKLSYVLAGPESFQRKKELMNSNLRGEFSSPDIRN